MIVCLFGLGLIHTADADDAQRLEFFESRIRPVLIKHCYECHSADSKMVQGGLRLDAADVFIKGGDSGSPITVGKPAESLLIDAIKYETLEMPPNRRLPANVIRDFEKWIADGAFDPREEKTGLSETPSIQQRIEAGKSQWAYQTPTRKATPELKGDQWSHNWVDRFLQDKWRQAELTLSADASRATLARRIYFDLTGLPPTKVELGAFLNDERPDAFRHLLDRLLASPAFGEHWGRMWLDVARYADSNGGDFNATFHEAWRYRNYVIDAFNSDKPFDQFAREQIAGDLLPYQNARQRHDQVVATGFLMLGPKMLSERDKEKLRMDIVDEQIDSMGRTFLGLTLGCARCHDHKFDPVPTQDYYALAGIFGSTQTLNGEIQKYVSNWMRQPLPLDEARRAKIEQHNRRLAAVTKQLTKAKQTHDKLKKLVAQREAATLGERLVVDDADAKRKGSWENSTRTPSYFGRGYIHDGNKAKGESSIAFAMQLEADGKYEVRVAYNHHSSRAAKVPVLIEHAGGQSELILNQQIPPKFKPFHPLGKFRFNAQTPARVTLFNRGSSGFVIADAVEFVPLTASGKPSSPSAQNPKLQESKKELARAAAALKDLEKKKSLLQKQAQPLPRALAAAEAKRIGDCRIHIRGEHRNLGASTPRGFLQVATSDTPQFDNQQSGRRQLAEWLASNQNPLTARVMANRIWRRLMGEGIVRSMDNFGRLGEPPTHPQLLDALAVELNENDWSVKHLVHLIASSHAYRMSSQGILRNQKADPENRLFWRANRKNIPAESIRDAMLMAGGMLDRTASESAVSGLGTLVTQNKPGDKGYQSKSNHRRTIYTAIIRNELPPMLTLFDFADPDFVIGRRPTTTTPAQSLLMLNSPFVRQAAENAATRQVVQASSADEHLDETESIEQLYTALLSRRPTRTESNRALEFIRLVKQDKATTDKATDKTTTDNVQNPSTAAGREIPAQELEAWVQLAHAILASTEFRMID